MARKNEIGVDVELPATLWIDHPQFVELLNNANRLIHAGEQFIQELVLELDAFCVAPIFFGLLPLAVKFLGDSFESGSVGVQ